MKLKKNLTFLTTVFLSTIVFNSNISSAIAKIQTFYPASILKLDNELSNNVLIIETSTNKLYVYKNNGGIPQFLKSFQVIGKKSTTNKTNSINYLENTLKINNEIYSEVVKNNDGYLVAGKSDSKTAIKDSIPQIFIGSNIDGNRKLTKSIQTILLSEDDTENLLNITDENAIVITTEDLSFIREETWKKNKSDLTAFINSWLDAWTSEDLNKYTSYYDKILYTDSKNRNYYKFKNYKKFIFQKNEAPQIEISNVSIIHTNKYTKVDFLQQYTSSSISDFGHKTLYLKKDNYYSWKIISEDWKKINNTKHGINQ